MMIIDGRNCISVGELASSVGLRPGVVRVWIAMAMQNRAVAQGASPRGLTVPGEVEFGLAAEALLVGRMARSASDRLWAALSGLALGFAGGAAADTEVAVRLLRLLAASSAARSDSLALGQ